MDFLRDAFGAEYACSQWCDLLELKGAEPLAWYGDDYYAGKPAVTVNACGQGQIYYAGTQPEERFWTGLLGGIADKFGIPGFAGLPEGVQISRRSGENGSFLFVLNLSREPQTLALPRDYAGLLGGAIHNGELKLEPFGVEILRLL
ncbi:hypothetical protein PSTEL_03830 [Paenibacillus stellifer]|uniref:Beta-galactosidase C-terminal domain-containing protein n=1 Tax=Paenibacillus stellifer TaxID=169760 RepID=A0A089LQI8_9BACL|nr:hypothetical protein PSTEL_03830 [Paenibacillus stellifer]